MFTLQYFKMNSRLVIKRLFSINFVSYSQRNKPNFVITNDNSTIVCWHPKNDFPYEFSKALSVEHKEETNSVLKCSWNNETKSVFKQKHPDIARQELMSITYTTKHRWYPRSRDKRAKDTPMDREYL